MAKEEESFQESSLDAIIRLKDHPGIIMMKTENALTLNKDVFPSCLPTDSFQERNFYTRRDYEFASCVITGWSKNLNRQKVTDFATVPIVTRSGMFTLTLFPDLTE